MKNVNMTFDCMLSKQKLSNPCKKVFIECWTKKALIIFNFCKKDANGQMIEGCVVPIRDFPLQKLRSHKGKLSN